MLATGGVILTSAGALMISRSLELVKPIEFTYMKIGTGDIRSLDNARALTDLVTSYMTINMSSIVRNENTIRIRGSFTNERFSNEVTIKEIGVFAKIGAEQSVLFGYVNDGQGEVIPPGNSGNVISRTRDLYIGVTSEAEAIITIDKSLVYSTIEDLEEGLNQKENKFNKNSGFNKTKSDATNLKDSETLATSMAVAKTMEKAEEALNSAGGKEPAFNKNTAFNKNFGTGQNEVLEGSKLAEIFGIEPGGNLNNTNLKVAGKAYYCTANKKTYKCIANTSINYADATYFVEISNNDILGKLQNLSENLLNWKRLSNWDYSYYPATYASFYLTDTEMSEYKEMLILYDTDTIASCKTKIVYKIEIDTRGGAYWHQTPSMEQAILTKNGNLIEIKASLGSKPLYFVAVYWR